MTHDPLCPVIDFLPTKFCCHYCVVIAKVRADEAPKAVTRWIEQGASSDDWMKVWQVRDYAEELEAKVRADTLDKARDAITRDVRELMRLIVREFPRFNGRDGAQEALNHAIEAIDALRGKS